MEAPLSPAAAAGPSSSGSGSGSSSEQLVHLRIKSPSLPLASSSLHASTSASSAFGAGADALDCLAVAPHTTILEVKRAIERAWPGRPRAEGMRCIRAGRLMRDEETVAGIGGDNPQDPASLHLVVRPDAWAEPQAATRPRLASRAPSVAAMRRQASADASLRRQASTDASLAFEAAAAAAAATAAASGASAPGATAAPGPAGPMAVNRCDLSLLRELMPTYSQSTARRLALAMEVRRKRYGDIYATLWHGLYGGSSPAPTPVFPQYLQKMEHLRQLSETCESLLGLPEVADDVQRAMPQEWEERIKNAASAAQPDGGQEEKLGYLQQAVEIGGLPYLLHLPLTPQVLVINDLLHHLHFRIGVLRDVSRALLLHGMHQAQLAEGRGAAAQPAGGHAAAATAAAAPAPAAAPEGAAVRVERRLLPALVLQELSAVAAPMIFLAFKLSILVYVFTRHAGDVKRWCIIGAATAYVFYEGLRIMQRRRRVRQREFAQRMMPGARMDVPPTPQAAQQAPQTPQRSEAGAGLRAPQRHRATSPLTLAFWIEHVAFLSLAEEDAELGLQPPAAGNAHDVQPQPQRLRGWRGRLYNNVALPAALFLGTLVPEVEIRRRRAIEEREELIRAEAAREEVRRRAKEAEREKKRRDEAQAEAEPSASSSALPTPTPTTTAQPPLLSSEYAARVLRRRGAGAHGRQIDIQQELDAAAQQEEEDDDEPDDMDLGFF